MADLSLRSRRTSHPAALHRRTARPPINATGWLRVVGPAFIAAIGYVDPGNYAANIQAGSRYGYSLLWVVFWANLISILVQYLSAKLGLVEGASLAHVVRDRSPRWVAWAYWLQAELLAIVTDVAEFIGAALGFKLLFGMTLLEGALLTGVVSWTVLVIGRRLRTMEGIIAAFLGLIAAAFLWELALAHPDWGRVASGVVVPRLQTPAAAFTAASLVGATVMPHVVYLHSALASTQAREDRQSPTEALATTRTDVLSAMGLASFVNLAMLAVAAAVFASAGSAVDGVEGAFRALGPLLGRAAAVVFAVSLVVSGLSSTVVGTLAGQEIMKGFLGFQVPVWIRRIVTMTPSLAIVGLGVGVDRVLLLTQVVLSFGIPLALIPLILFTSRRREMGALANGPVVRALGWASVAVVVALNAYLVLNAASG